MQFGIWYYYSFHVCCLSEKFKTLTHSWSSSYGKLNWTLLSFLCPKHLEGNHVLPLFLSLATLEDFSERQCGSKPHEDINFLKNHSVGKYWFCRPGMTHQVSSAIYILPGFKIPYRENSEFSPMKGWNGRISSRITGSMAFRSLNLTIQYEIFPSFNTAPIFML